MAVVKNLMVRAGADFSAMKKEMDRTQKQLKDFKRGMSNTLKGIGATIATLGIGMAIKEATRSAMEVEASLNQINRLMGESSQAFLDWADNTALAFNMSRSEATKYGAVYGNLLSNFSRDMNETAKYTQDLLETSAVVASATGRTMEDTMERIRSGLLGNTEAIEDLGINVNVAMIESTEAFRRFANDKSWLQLDFQTQQQIRYFAILEQAAQKYGNEIADSTISRQQQLIAQLKNIQLHLGNAFLPIYNRVLPALTSLASKLAHVMSVIAQFSQALFGKPNTGQTQNTTSVVDQQSNAVSDLGNSYKKTGKEAKKAQGFLAGFDEVNTVTKKGADGSGGDSPLDAVSSSGIGDNGIIPVDFETNAPEISPKVQEMARKIKEAFGNMTQFIKDNKDIIISALTGIAIGFTTMYAAMKWGTIVAAVKKAGTVIAAAIGGISWPIVAIGAAVAALVGAFVYFYRTNEKFKGVVDGILNKIKDAALTLWNKALVPLGEFLKGALSKAWDFTKDSAERFWKDILVPFGKFLASFWHDVLTPIGKELKDVLAIAFDTVAEVAKSFWQNVLVPLGNFFSNAFGPTVEAIEAVFTSLWNNALKPLGSFISDVFEGVWDDLSVTLKDLWNNVLKPLVGYMSQQFINTFDSVFQSIGGLIKDLEGAYIALMNFITNVFTGDWEDAWNGVKDIFGDVFESLYGLVKTPLNKIIDGINRVIGGLNKIKIDIPDWVPGFGGERFGISIPRIPKLARGGIVDQETNMGNYIAGEAGAEMIVPLENTSFVEKLAGSLGAAVANAMSSTSNESGDIILKVGEIELGRVAARSINKAQRVSGNLLLDI